MNDSRRPPRRPTSPGDAGIDPLISNSGQSRRPEIPPAGGSRSTGARSSGSRSSSTRSTGSRAAAPRRAVAAGAASANPRRWVPLAVAGALVVVLVIAAIATGGGSGHTDATTVPESIPVVETEPSTTEPEIVVDSTADVVKTTLASTLKMGSAGSDVTALQQRLTDLGFRPGGVDGKYGNATRMAVWAFQKLVQGIPRAQASGVVDNDTWQLMQDPIKIAPRRPNATATHLEVYLDLQVAAIFRDGAPVFISHISSGELEADGTPKWWCEDVEYTERNGVPLDEPQKTRECAFSKTPGGVFTVTRKVDGNRKSVLGGMLNPVYFNYGIAIHGAYTVPSEPASHGCVRVPNSLSREVFDLLNKGDQVFVWDGKKEPEQQSKNESLPSFNQTDREWLATSTTSSTTTTTTTIAPTTTTHPATTTTRPATTTTGATTTAPTTTTTVPETPPDDDPDD